MAIITCKNGKNARRLEMSQFDLQDKICSNLLEHKLDTPIMVEIYKKLSEVA